MTKSGVSPREPAQALGREPRPFLFLEPARLPLRPKPLDPVGQQQLGDAIEPSLGHLVRSLVDYTIERQNRDRLRGLAQPIQMSVLNRRRRAARSWLLAIAAGRVDAATRHAVASQWLPMLCGTGPERRGLWPAARRLVEFVRGGLTALVFEEPADNLLPAARALNVLENTLAAHLAAVRELVRGAP